MKLIDSETSSEEVMVSSCCGAECTYGSSWLDGFWACNKCDKSTFTENIRAEGREKITITLTYLK